MHKTISAIALAACVLFTGSIPGQEPETPNVYDLPENSSLQFVMLEYPGQLIVTQVKQVPVTVTETRKVARLRQETRTRNAGGEEQTYTVDVPYVEEIEVQREILHAVQEQKTVQFESVKFSSITGQVVNDAQRLKKHLQTPRPAVVLYGNQKLSPFYEKVLKSSTIVMHVPDSQEDKNPVFDKGGSGNAREFYEPGNSISSSEGASAPHRSDGGIR